MFSDSCLLGKYKFLKKGLNANNVSGVLLNLPLSPCDCSVRNKILTLTERNHYSENNVSVINT